MERMNSLEDELRQALLRGEMVDLTNRAQPCSADALGRLADQNPVRGIRLRGATLDGTLDLADARLTALVLENCVVPERVNLLGANIGRLSLRGSRIGHVDAAGAVVAGSVDFSNVSPADQFAWIDLSAAQIGGGIVARGARLHTPTHRRPNQVLPWTREYALRLSRADVRNGIDLNGGFDANGGVTLEYARIAGGFSARGARLSQGEGDEFHPGDALNANGAQVKGGLFLNFGLQSVGRIVMIAIRIDGTLSLGLQDSKIGQDAAGADSWLPGQLSSQSTLVIDNAVVSGDVFLAGCTVDCAVSLRSATIGGNLQIEVPPKFRLP